MIVPVICVLSFYLSLCQSDNIVLDISKDVDFSRFHVEKGSNSKVTTHKYYRKSDFKITKVVDGECVIWDGGIKGEVCVTVTQHLIDNSSLNVHIKVLGLNKGNNDLYYEKRGKTWVQTDLKKSESYYHLNQFLDVKLVRFDVNSNPDIELFKVERTIKNGFIKKVCSPKIGVSITSVDNKNEKIWEKNENSKFFQITISYIRNEAILAELTVQNNNGLEYRYFENRNEKWVEITPKSYVEKSKGNDLHFPLYDIKNLDLTKFSVEEYEVLGTNTIVYTPLIGTTILNIAEGNIPIWGTKGGNCVDKIWLYSRGGKYLTTILRVIDSNERQRLINYKRIDGEWKLVVNEEL
uniref:SfiI-subtelomeric related protein family member n=1 Tax=Theileria annulata TaxID=5874 RepID=A0A3B0MZR3_THEAN